MSLSEEQKIFVCEPIGSKSVSDLPGITEMVAKGLEEKGFDKAYMVLGKFLALKKNMESFVEWLIVTGQADAHQAIVCWNSLNAWCKTNI